MQAKTLVTQYLANLRFSSTTLATLRTLTSQTSLRLFLMSAPTSPRFSPIAIIFCNLSEVSFDISENSKTLSDIYDITDACLCIFELANNRHKGVTQQDFLLLLLCIKAIDRIFATNNEFWCCNLNMELNIRAVVCEPAQALDPRKFETQPPRKKRVYETTMAAATAAVMQCCFCFRTLD